MLKFMGKLLDSNDSSVEAHVFLFALVILAIIGMTVYDVVFLQHAFAVKDFGIGAASAFGGCGAASWGTGSQRNAQGSSNAGPS